MRVVVEASGAGVQRISPRADPVIARSPGAMITVRDTTRRRPASGDAASRPVVRGSARRTRRPARAHPHDHRDRQRALHHHDVEPGAPPPRRRVRGGHRVRATAGQQLVHARAPGRHLGARDDARHDDRQPRLRRGRVPRADVRRRHPARRVRGRRRTRIEIPARCRASSRSNTAGSTSATSSCAGRAGTR